MSAESDAVVAQNLRRIRSRIEAACLRTGRDPAEVTLVAVSKTQPESAIRAAYAAGQRVFGESYVQEWRLKASALPSDIRWHFIGRLQSNKARVLADGPIACVESIDRLVVAQRLADRLERQANRGAPLPVFVEVDLSQEASKGGVAEDELADLVAAVDALRTLRVEGLMAIPAWHDDAEMTRPAFRELARLRAVLNQDRPEDARLTHLSMGMSHDFEVAIEEGATLVRVGTAIFGER